MANSRTLLVYVLALAVCGGGSSFWASANTVPLVKEPVAATGASPKQHQQQFYAQQQPPLPLPTAQHQRIPEASRTPPALLLSSATRPVDTSAEPLPQSFYPLPNSPNGVPQTYDLKNVWGLNAGSSDSGPYATGYGYLAGGRTLNSRQVERVPSPGTSTSYPLMERLGRQTYQHLDNMTAFLQSFFGGALDLKSALLGGVLTLGATNFPNLQLPETFYPMVRYFRTRIFGSSSPVAEKEAAIMSNEIPNSKTPGKQEAIVTREESKKVKTEPVKESVTANKTEEKATSKNAPKKRESVVPSKEVAMKESVKASDNAQENVETGDSQDTKPVNHEEEKATETAEEPNQDSYSNVEAEEPTRMDTEEADVEAVEELSNQIGRVESEESIADTLELEEPNDITINAELSQPSEEDINEQSEAIFFMNPSTGMAESIEDGSNQPSEAIIESEKVAPKEEETTEPQKDVPNKDEEATESQKDVTSKNQVAKSRKRRDVQSVQVDTDLTELAAMVLSAIQSGECMQRSICLMGSQIGASNKGRLAFILVDKLIPESVQGNQYFLTLKKALKGGEGYCNRFRCRLR